MKKLIGLLLAGALASCATAPPPPKPAAPAPVVEAPAPAPAPAPVVAAPAPAPVVEAPKKKKIALGLPALPSLKEDVGMDPKQVKACKAIYDEYKPKIDETAAKVKAADDKKAANKEIAAPLRKEVLAKLRAVCADDAQRAKFDELTAPAKKKKPAKP